MHSKSLKFTSKLVLSSCFIFIALNLVAQKYPGYTLIATQGMSGGTSAKLIDTSGVTFKSWTGFASSSGYSAYMLPGGYLIRGTKASGVSFTGGPICGKVTKTDWSGTVVWDYTYSTTNYCTHHDICPMPNGNVLLIAYERRTATETTAMGGNSSIEMWPDKIVEVMPTGATTGTVVWEWKAWDHLQQNVTAAKPNYKATLVPERLNINYRQAKDWLHVNGVDYNAELDQITFSSHNSNEIYVIDHSTTMAEAASSTGGRSGKGGDILYRFGNPLAYGGTGTATINVCHDAHWIDAGPFKNYLAYFNNFGVSTTKSAVDFVNPPLVANGFTYTKTGAQYGPSTYSKRYPCNGVTTNEGGSHSLPNGNLLYTIALSGNIYEVDSAGTTRGSWSAGGTDAKAKRYTSCELNGGLTATCSPYSYNFCGIPSSPIVLSCTGNGTGTMSYNWSSYPAGFTSTAQNPTVSPTSSITYKCEVTNGTCTATNYIVVNIRPKPTVNAGNDTLVGISAPVTLTANSTNTVSYLWSTGATTQSINVTPASTTVYKVVVTSAGGCKDSDEVVVTVQGGLLSASATASKPLICIGATTVLTGLGSGGSGTYTYSWSSVPAGFTSVLTTVSVSPIVTTQYNLTVNDGTGNANSSCTVTVNSLPPTPVVTKNINTFTSSATVGNQWYKDAVIIPGAIAMVYMASSTGDYTVKVTDANGCESAFSNSNSYTGISKPTRANEIKVYPNPTTGMVQIDFDSEIEVIVTDISGKVILRTTTKTVDLSELENGIYFFKIFSDNKLNTVAKISLLR